MRHLFPVFNVILIIIGVLPVLAFEAVVGSIRNLFKKEVSSDQSQ